MGEGGGRLERLPPYAGAIVTIVAAVAGFVAVYVTLGRPDNAGSGASRPVAAVQPKPGAAARLNTGHMAAFVYKKVPEPLAAVAFVDGEGRQRTLADWKGRVVLLNLWATWCAPCRKEMPELDQLQADMGSDRFEVVALAVDRAGVEAARKFLQQINASALRLYVDATARGVTELKAAGLPTTVLIDREGREIGRLTGPAEWNSADARRLVQSVIGN